MNTIKSKDNPTVKYVSKLIKSAKARRENREFVAEGLRLCYDAFLSDAHISTVLYTASALKKDEKKVSELIGYAERAYEVSDSIFASFSDTKSPQGILCIIKTLDKPTLFDKIKCNGKFLALDNIQDPSNLGTVLRTAEALGLDGVVLSADCCDIHSPKVVRGSMGAVFRLPFILVDTIAGFLSKHSEFNSYAAVVDDTARQITEIEFKTPCIAVIGNEANGLKQATIDACDMSVTIPMKGRAESLNAAIAAGIIIWEMSL